MRDSLGPVKHRVEVETDKDGGDVERDVGEHEAEVAPAVAEACSHLQRQRFVVAAIDRQGKEDVLMLSVCRYWSPLEYGQIPHWPLLST